MRRIAAHYVFPVSSPPVRNGIVVLDGEGRITDLTDPGGRFREMAALVFYDGILIPAFVLPEGGTEGDLSGGDMTALLRDLFPPAGRKQNSRDDFNRQLRRLTLEAAERSGVQESMGSLEKGKKPGILLISPFDFERWQPAAGATVERIA